MLHVIDSTANKEDGFVFEGKLVFDVYNKCDLLGQNAHKPKTSNNDNTFYVSAKTGEGVENVAKAIVALFKENKVNGGEMITSERHISALYQAERALKNAIVSKDATLDLLLIDLTEAYNSLGEITGKTATENVVDSIFSRFCVGK